MIQETTNALKQTVHSLYYYSSNFGKSLRSVKATYDLLDIPLGMADGQVSYPAPDVEKPSGGMTVEFRWAIDLRAVRYVSDGFRAGM